MSKADSEASQRPDGIDARQARTGKAGHANPLGLLVLGAAMLAAMLGLAGYEVERAVSGNGVTLAWHAPERIRNGEFFEMRITVDTTQPIQRLILGVDAGLWTDFTINTIIPAAAEEISRDGEFRFDFGALDSGHSLLVKVDAQINPDAWGGHAGTLTVYDGERPLTDLALHIDVLP